MKTFREEVRKIILEHNPSMGGSYELEEMIEAILGAVEKIVPKKMRFASNHNEYVGYNLCRAEMLKKLREGK